MQDNLITEPAAPWLQDIMQQIEDERLDALYSDNT